MREAIQAYNRQKEEIDRAYAERTDPLEEERQVINNLLIIQQRKLGEKPSASTPIESLSSFLIQQTRKIGRISKEDLRISAVKAGYFSVDDGGGRVVHATLLNLVRSGRLQEYDDSTYSVPSKPDLLVSGASRVEGVFK